MALHWDASLKVGIRGIDADHQRLFQAISELERSAELGQFSGEFLHTIDFLMEYVKEHFRREENLMIEYNFPGYYQHKRLHEEFKEIVYALRTYLHISDKAIDPKKVIAFLDNWLVHHISKSPSARFLSQMNRL